jgi:arylesterase / paraoxonase
MRKKIIIIACVLLGVVAIFVLKTLKDAGEFKNLAPHSDCSCAKVTGVPGPEDIAIDNSTGIAYVSSFDRRAFLSRKKLLQGAIFSYTLAGKPVLKNLTENLKIAFYPHGISFFRSADGKKFLFVINHQADKNQVEIFEIAADGLVHRETVGGELMISPNDIAAVGPRKFYFTNDHGSKSQFARQMEDYLQLSRASVAYYDGKSIRLVAGGLSYANGIWATADGKLLYVSTTTGRKFYVYNRAADGSLALARGLELGTGADNIDIDEGGVIRVACHPKLLTFTKHAADEGIKSPSQVLEISRDAKGEYSFKETYLNPGDEISGASVAAAYRNRLLLGDVFENFFLDCTMKK